MNVEQRLKDLEKAAKECIEVPNEWLPVDFQNQKEGCVTLSRLEELCEEKFETTTQHQKDKEEKARRIEIYRKQYEQDDRPDELAGLDYVDINEDKLYRNQMNFAKYCPAVNLEEEDE